MRHRTHKSHARRFIGSVEHLDQRALLATGPVATVTPAASEIESTPVAPVVSPLLAQAFETQIARMNQEFITEAEALNNLLIARINHYQAKFASSAASVDARVERLLRRGLARRRVRLSMPSALLNAQVARQQAFFNEKAARLASSFQNQMANLASGFARASSQFAAPGSAFFGNLQAAATAFSAELSSALTAVATNFQNGSAAINSLVSNPATAFRAQTQAGATGSLVGVVPPFPQAFNSAFTQTLGAVTANIQGLTGALQQNFGSFQAQFATNSASLMNALAFSPFSTFPTLPTYVVDTALFAGSTGIGTSPNNFGVGNSGVATSIGNSGVG